MAIPSFDISKAYLYSPKSDTDGTELEVGNEKKVYAQNMNQTQNELGYFWASADIPFSLESQDKTSKAIANYVFENILEDRSNIEQHNNITDLYVADRINFQNNTKTLGTSNHKGVLFFMPSFNNTSSSVNFQIYNQPVLKLYKRDGNNELIDLEPNDIVAGNICMVVYNYQESIPCFILYGMFSKNLIEEASGKYAIDKKMDLVNEINNEPIIRQTVLNTKTGVLSKDKVGDNGVDVTAYSVYTIYKIDNNGTIHYREKNLKAGDIIFIVSEGNFYYYDGTYIMRPGIDGRYVFDAYTDNGTTIDINIDRSDLVYISPISGNRTITISGNPTHMQKVQIFLDITEVGTYNFPFVSNWLDNITFSITDTGVYVLVFVYDAIKNKWIGNNQGSYK